MGRSLDLIGKGMGRAAAPIFLLLNLQKIIPGSHKLCTWPCHGTWYGYVVYWFKSWPYFLALGSSGTNVVLVLVYLPYMTYI